MDQIDGPYVINLDHRTDRWTEVQAEFARIGATPTRVSATYTPGDGATGCMASHVDVLSRCAEKPIWVCEDDLCFLVPRDTLDRYIREFMESDADILCIGFANYKHTEYNNTFFRTIDCQTTSSYIAKPAAAAALRQLWGEVLNCRRTKSAHPYERLYKAMRIHNPDFYCADQCWKILQQRFKFIIPKERTAFQREGFSDIEGRVVNYRC